MVEETTAVQDTESKPKKRRLLSPVMLIVAGISFGAAGFALPLLIPGVFAKGNGSRPYRSPQETSKPAFINFGDIVVNLNSDRFNRYLRVGITLQVYQSDVEKVSQLLDKHRAILKSWLLSYLSDKSMEEIRGSAGQNRLRREIHQYFNSVLFTDGYDRIRDVLFEEFNVQ